ncbi:363_t:CDS:2, partial [Funneliformis mosseae]
MDIMNFIDAAWSHVTPDIAAFDINIPSSLYLPTASASIPNSNINLPDLLVSAFVYGLNVEIKTFVLANYVAIDENNNEKPEQLKEFMGS